MIPEYPTSITFDARTLSPTRNPATNTVAAASSQTGQTGMPREGVSRRAIQRQRSSTHASGGYASAIAVKTQPWLKNQRETENESSTSRSALRIDSRRRQSTRPSRNSPQNASHTG